MKIYAEGQPLMSLPDLLAMPEIHDLNSWEWEWPQTQEFRAAKLISEEPHRSAWTKTRFLSDGEQPRFQWIRLRAPAGDLSMYAALINVHPPACEPTPQIEHSNEGTSFRKSKQITVVWTKKKKNPSVCIAQLRT